jgi:hypothetical protein
VATDRQGRFRIEGLRPQAYRLLAKIGPLAAEFEVAASVVPGAPPADYAVPPLRDGQRPPSPTDPNAKGRVRLVGHDGGAVSFASIEIRVADEFMGYIDMVDGVFVRSPFEPWNMTFVISVPVDAGRRPLPYGPVVASFSDHGESEVTVRLPAERAVEGRLLGPDGNGLAGIEVGAYPPGSEIARQMALPFATARTGTRGEFHLGSLGEGTYALHAQLPAGLLASGDWTVSPRPDEIARVDLHARAGLSVTLRVLGTRNEPVAQAMVSAMRSDVPVMFGRDPKAFATHPTDADGRVTLEGLAPEGTYVLSVTPPQGRDDLQILRRDDWKPAAGDVVLEPGYAVTGVVHDDRGAPARAFIYRKQPDGTFRPVGAAQADGRFLLRGLPSGPLTLAAATGPGKPTGPEVTTEAGTSGIVLLLPAAR